MKNKAEKKLEQKLEYLRGDIITVDQGIRQFIANLGEREKSREELYSKYFSETSKN